MKLNKNSKKNDKRSLTSSALSSSSTTTQSTNGSINCHFCGSLILSKINFVQKSTDEKWLSSFQAANFLAISVQALMNMSSNGKVPYHKLGRRNRYRYSDLLAMLERERRGKNEY